MQAPHKALEVARYFLAKVDLHAGDNLSNLKLQKLLYYAQGFHLAMRGETLFEEKLFAWSHGPVVKAVYQRYKDYQWRAIDPPRLFNFGGFAPETAEILEAVLQIYGQFSAKRLEDMAHEEQPWASTARHQEIARESLKSYFLGYVEAGESGESLHGRPVWPIRSFRFQRRQEIARRMEALMPSIRERVRPLTAGDDPWAGEDWSR